MAILCACASDQRGTACWQHARHGANLPGLRISSQPADSRLNFIGPAVGPICALWPDQPNLSRRDNLQFVESCVLVAMESFHFNDEFFPDFRPDQSGCPGTILSRTGIVVLPAKQDDSFSLKTEQGEI